MVCKLEAWAEIVQQLTKLMAASIFSTDMVRGRGSMGEYVRGRMWWVWLNKNSENLPK